MKSTLVARRYVRALFDIASESGSIEQIGTELQMADQLLGTIDHLRAYLLDPATPRQEKQAMLDNAFIDAGNATRNFFKVVIDKNRPEVLLVAYPLYLEMMRKYDGIAVAVVETAVPIVGSTMDDIRVNLEREFNTKLSITYKVSPEIVGGLRIQIGNLLVDRSVKGNLNRMAKVLAGN